MYELAVPFEVFGIDRSDLVEDWYDTKFVETNARASPVFTLVEPAALDQAHTFDTLVVPPTRPIDFDYPQPVLDAICAAHSSGTRIVSLCTGAFVLAASGLLDGRSATTHWMYSAQFRARFPTVDLTPDILYVDNGDVLTSAGKSAAMDLCLYLVRKDFGSRVSNEIARRLVTPPHRAGNQAQFMNKTTVYGSVPPVLDDISQWLEGKLQFSLTVEDIAHHAHLSSRQLSRIFNTHYQMTPRQWIEQQRIFLAQRYLESTDKTATWIASASGFGSYATLRRAFHRNVGLAPEEYRKTFSEDNFPPARCRPVPPR